MPNYLSLRSLMLASLGAALVTSALAAQPGADRATPIKPGESCPPGTTEIRPRSCLGPPYRCAAEPVDDYVRKGGLPADTEGRRCLCNALTANVGYAQLRVGGYKEQPLLTSGDDLKTISRFLGGRTSYTAHDVIVYLLGNSLEA